MSKTLKVINSDMNIILRDIKSENIMIAEAFEPSDNVNSDKIKFRLIDFGFAHQFHCHNDICYRHSGTPHTVCYVYVI